MSMSGSGGYTPGSGSVAMSGSYTPSGSYIASGSYTPSGSYTASASHGSYMPSGSYTASGFTPGSGSEILQVSSSSGPGGHTPISSDEIGYDICPSTDLTDMSSRTITLGHTNSKESSKSLNTSNIGYSFQHTLTEIY